MEKFTFPVDFVWGTATSAHQVEGNNTNSDWWEWEEKRSLNQEFPREKSGIACDSYNRYEEDFDICKELNNNAVRFSVEWARLEPTQGTFNQAEFNHYREVLLAAKARGLKTFVTLHHFTNPLWFSKKGGWANSECISLFANYAKKVAEELGDHIDFFLTINEPQVYMFQSYFRGIWPPQKKNPFVSLFVQRNMIHSHNRAATAIKKVNPQYQVGLVKNIVWYETDPYTKAKIWDKIAVKMLNWLGRDSFLWPIRKHLDLIGLNYYFTNRITNLRRTNPDDYVSDLNWWINPKGLEHILVYLKRYHVPVYITENGLADAKDQYRQRFIVDHLIACAMAMKRGAHLKGYFYWSLLDNFEWHEGFWPRFGLVEIDREHDLKRTLRDSGYMYGEVCKENTIRW